MNASPSPRPPWQLDAKAVVAKIAAREITALGVAQSVLQRIDAVNPSVNALVDVMVEEAIASAKACDNHQSLTGNLIGPLHGVPITIKVNVDVVGRPTTEGVVALKDNLATSDSPMVKNLRDAGAVIVGRSNTPAFSLRWFTDNDVHGRTFNPYRADATPGGSSGGAAVASATGMGAIAHGNDYGGSIRYPAWCCGVVGLRTTAGRVPAYKATMPNRVVSNQWMSVQGPLTRTVADARLALAVMARGSALDPLWVDAPLEYPAQDGMRLRVGVFASHVAYDSHEGITADIHQAARWLQAAGCDVEPAEPPHFEAAADLWRHLVMDDMRRGALAAIDAMGDAGVQSAVRGYMHNLPPLDANELLEAQARRLVIARAWSVHFERYHVLLMPNSWQPPFPVNADRAAPADVLKLVHAQSPLLATAMLGLPGLSVPTGMRHGLPTGVQLVATRFREDLLLNVGEMIERAAGFDGLKALAGSSVLRAM